MEVWNGMRRSSYHKRWSKHAVFCGIIMSVGCDVTGALLSYFTFHFMWSASCWVLFRVQRLSAISNIVCVYVCTVYTKKVASEQDLGLRGKILGGTIFYSHRNLIEFPKASDVWNEFFTVWESKAGFLIVPQKFHCKTESKNPSKKILFNSIYISVAIRAISLTRLKLSFSILQSILWRWVMGKWIPNFFKKRLKQKSPHMSPRRLYSQAICLHTYSCQE